MLVAVQSRSDTVYFENGEVTTGKIVTMNDEFIVLETGGELQEIYRKDIEKIELSDRFTNLSNRRFALTIRNPAGVLYLIANDLHVGLQGQIVLTKRFSVTTIGYITGINGEYGGELLAGLQFRGHGYYLDGFFLGVYPGIEYRPEYISPWVFMALFEYGHQWVRDSGFTIGLSGGFYYWEHTETHYGVFQGIYTSLQIGYAFKTQQN
jgi:hypothetical protein